MIPDKIKEFLALIEEHGLLSKILTPEMAEAFGAGLGRGIAEGLLKGAQNK